MLGGLIRENHTVNNDGIPGLKDIPAVGILFSSRGDTTTRHGDCTLPRTVAIRLRPVAESTSVRISPSRAEVTSR